MAREYFLVEHQLQCFEDEQARQEVHDLNVKGFKARLHWRFLSQQLNAIFVAPKLQLKNRTCKPGAILVRFQAIYRRGMRYNSPNTVSLSSSFTF